jgi:hypothetical protein
VRPTKSEEKGKDSPTFPASAHEVMKMTTIDTKRKNISVLSHWVFGHLTRATNDAEAISQLNTNTATNDEPGR